MSLRWTFNLAAKETHKYKGHPTCLLSFGCKVTGPRRKKNDIRKKNYEKEEWQADFLRKSSPFSCDPCSRTGSACEREPGTSRTEVLSLLEGDRGGVKCPTTPSTVYRFLWEHSLAFCWGEESSCFPMESALPGKLTTTTLVSSQKEKP